MVPMTLTANFRLGKHDIDNSVGVQISSQTTATSKQEI